LVLCRAGGTTLAELCAAGKPAIIVPYPYAAERHQHVNATVLAAAGAAVVLDQAQLHGERLARLIVELLDDEPRRRRMAQCSRELGRPDAARAVFREVRDCIRAALRASGGPSALAARMPATRDPAVTGETA
jgi:UDP-N-acetylglucosamine--N-acetylmuramyl-(pentapeptide) pyrophosphoryl-undecaprenol N-acetylglucosamine transferase